MEWLVFKTCLFLWSRIAGEVGISGEALGSHIGKFRLLFIYAYYLEYLEQTLEKGECNFDI